MARDLQRFARKLKQHGECWLWTGHKDRKGYGQFKFQGVAKWAHRWSYATFIAPIPAGETINHKCANPSCVNPEHLHPMSRSENTAEGNRRRASGVAA
jgi:hypothetical protein